MTPNLLPSDHRQSKEDYERPIRARGSLGTLEDLAPLVHLQSIIRAGRLGYFRVLIVRNLRQTRSSSNYFGPPRPVA